MWHVQKGQLSVRMVRHLTYVFECVEHVCTQIQLWVCIHTMHACLCLGASLGCGAHYKKTALWQRLF